VIRHCPMRHSGVACGSEHVTPDPIGAAQPPQWVKLVLTSVSHPLLGLLSQSPKPTAQLGLQTPAAQVVVPFVFEQALVQLPQCAGSVSVLVSQPLVYPAESQSRYGGVQL